MKKILSIAALLFACAALSAKEDIQYLWTKKTVPDYQEHQYAIYYGTESTNRLPFIKWYAAPENPNGGVVVFLSGGSYNMYCDSWYFKQIAEPFTALGFQCVDLVYRTPRPVGLEFYQTGWEDGQRGIRMIKSQAAKRGFDPEKVGVLGVSAGSHLSLLLASSSQTAAYEPKDKIDEIDPSLQWAALFCPAYVTTDANGGTQATQQGYGVGVTISPVFKFDEKTCPMIMLHGGDDPWSPNGSTQIYRELRKRKIPAEVHLYPDVQHGVFGFDRILEFLTQMGFARPLQPQVALMDRYPSDEARDKYIAQDIWPEGKMPIQQAHQCHPFIEWHFPKELKTKAIQIIYSGGSYVGNDPNGFEVAPMRRFFNEKGMTVVTMTYRTPRPEGYPKYLSAWMDLQRAIRVVRSQAEGFGLDPDRIGIMGSSAGGHLTLMGVTSSRHRSYLPIDDLDRNVSCKVQWGVGIYPAYALSDGLEWLNKNGGNLDTDILAPEFSFDLDTAPMIFIHGDSDGWAAMNSVKTWEKMRAMGIQSECHTLALREHCFQYSASPETGSYTWMERVWEFLVAKKFL